MLKKILSFILGIVFCFFYSGNLNSAYATDNIKSGKAQISKTITVTDKEVAEKVGRSNTKNYNGIKNIINHPFKIIFRAGGWAILGALSGIILPINGFILSLICLICGAASMMIELYNKG